MRADDRSRGDSSYSHLLTNAPTTMRAITPSTTSAMMIPANVPPAQPTSLPLQAALDLAESDDTRSRSRGRFLLHWAHGQLLGCSPGHCFGAIYSAELNILCVVTTACCALHCCFLLLEGTRIYPVVPNPPMGLLAVRFIPNDPASGSSIAQETRGEKVRWTW